MVEYVPFTISLFQQQKGIKGGNFNPIPIDRVNKSFSNNIIQTYKCYILLETSGQGLPI